jgi:hypothetical protein
MTQPRRLLLRTLIIALIALPLTGCQQFWYGETQRPPLAHTHTATLAGLDREFDEPFGIAIRDGDVYVSDGASGNILRSRSGGRVEIVAGGFNTPSAIAFLPNGDLIVADTGSHTIRALAGSGSVSIVAGNEHVSGVADGPAASATFNGPVGIAVASDGSIFVADTYNDRIRVVRNGTVSTVAGGTRGFADGTGSAAQFDTPLGLVRWHDKVLVADSGNGRVRVVEPDGNVWSLAGTGDGGLRDGSPSAAGLAGPVALATDGSGPIFVADGNSIRVIGRRAFPFVETLSEERRGYIDGGARIARFSRPSGIAIDEAGNLLVADSDNQVVRVLSGGAAGRQAQADEFLAMHIPATEFKGLQPPRWPYEPPDAAREIAGTLGEIRGEIGEETITSRFHNGLDIAGGYGEIARFVRTETVLDPHAAQNFDTARELLRMPTVGYIHLRLGRDRTGTQVSDDRFQFERDDSGRIVDLRVRRGTTFRAGEILGTLNSQNHVHLIAGPPGAEINALAALGFPGVSDTIPPVIEKVELLGLDSSAIPSVAGIGRVGPGDKLRLVVDAYDRMDGNAEHRRLGVYRLGYQVFESGAPVGEIDWTIVFDRTPPNEAVGLVYALGSRAGATGRTTFRYIVTNRVSGQSFSEDFLDSTMLGPGRYVLRAYAADYFGNTTFKDLAFEVVR